MPPAKYPRVEVFAIKEALVMFTFKPSKGPDLVEGKSTAMHEIASSIMHHDLECSAKSKPKKKMVSFVALIIHGPHDFENQELIISYSEKLDAIRAIGSLKPPMIYLGRQVEDVINFYEKSDNLKSIKKSVGKGFSPNIVGTMNLDGKMKLRWCDIKAGILHGEHLGEIVFEKELVSLPKSLKLRIIRPKSCPPIENAPSASRHSGNSLARRKNHTSTPPAQVGLHAAQPLYLDDPGLRAIKAAFADSDHSGNSSGSGSTESTLSGGGGPSNYNPNNVVNETRGMHFNDRPDSLSTNNIFASSSAGMVGNGARDHLLASTYTRIQGCPGGFPSTFDQTGYNVPGFDNNMRQLEGEVLNAYAQSRPMGLSPSVISDLQGGADAYSQNFGAYVAPQGGFAFPHGQGAPASPFKTNTPFAGEMMLAGPMSPSRSDTGSEFGEPFSPSVHSTFNYLEGSESFLGGSVGGYVASGETVGGGMGSPSFISNGAGDKAAVATGNDAKAQVSPRALQKTPKGKTGVTSITAGVTEMGRSAMEAAYDGEEDNGDE